MKIRQWVQIEREWRYLMLAVQPIEGWLFWFWIENLKAESIAPVLQRWGQEGLGEVNPGERVFEELRRAIEGQVYDGLEEKVARVEEELHRLAAEPERVRRVTGWSWIQKAWAGSSRSFIISINGFNKHDWY